MNQKLQGEQLSKIFECGEKAGIKHAMFLAFGTLLGYVREKDIIAHDTDSDVGIRSDWITAEQETEFYRQLQKTGPTNKGLFEARARAARRSDTNRFLWLSLKWDLNRNKNCIWFMFPWKRYLYHCKGGRWLKKIGYKPEVKKMLPTDLENYETIMKGNTLRYFDRMEEVKFYGTTMNIPWMSRSILDEYYPNWAVPKAGGSSARFRTVLIKKWEDEKTWIVLE